MAIEQHEHGTLLASEAGVAAELVETSRWAKGRIVKTVYLLSACAAVIGVAAVSLRPTLGTAPAARTTSDTALRAVSGLLDAHGQCEQCQCNCDTFRSSAGCDASTHGGQCCFSCCCGSQVSGTAPLVTGEGYQSMGAAPVVQTETVYVVDPVPQYRGAHLHQAAAGDAYHGSVGDAYHGSAPGYSFNRHHRHYGASNNQYYGARYAGKPATDFRPWIWVFAVIILLALGYAALNQLVKV